MTGRRGLTGSVVLCLAGAVLVLVTARAGWVVEVTGRPAPFPDERTTLTGGDLRPWLPALAWVALAGAGALLATRASARRLVGGLLVAAGAGIAVGAGAPVAGASAGGWRALAVAGGLAVAGAGMLAVARSRSWPAMGTRYERTGVPRPARRASSAEVWDALDRGEDPTR